MRLQSVLFPLVRAVLPRTLLTPLPRERLFSLSRGTTAVSLTIAAHARLYLLLLSLEKVNVFSAGALWNHCSFERMNSEMTSFYALGAHRMLQCFIDSRSMISVFG